MTMDYGGRVTVELRGNVAHVTLTRAEKMNAVDNDMAEAIVAAGEDLIGRRDLRAVVLSGEGRAFCAGLDVASFAILAGADPEAHVIARSHGECNIYQRLVMVWREIPVPVIAALHGVAYGAGLQLALGADIRIGHPDLKMAVMEAKWGLIPDMAGMVLMPRILRSDVMRLLTYTAQPVGAEEALGWGLLTRLDEDPQTAAAALAQVIASRSPSAIRAAKDLIDFAESGEDAPEVLMRESRVQVGLIGNVDQREILMAQSEQREPVFD